MTLRRRMHLVFGVLLAAWLVVCVGAFAVGRAMMRSLERIEARELRLGTQREEQGRVIDTVEGVLIAVSIGEGGSQEALRRAIEQFQSAFAVESVFWFGPGDEGSPAGDVHALHEALLGLADGADAQIDRVGALTVLGEMPAIRQSIGGVWNRQRTVFEDERAGLQKRIRALGIWGAFVFIVMQVGSFLVLLHSMVRIIGPVEDLVRASRRVDEGTEKPILPAPDGDEISELAHACASMRDQLSRSEQHTMDVLHQVAVTLSHELINTIATIDAQLSVIERSRAGETSVASPLYEIRASLQRMVRTVDSLARMRSVVLTDYVAGVRMVDLSKSAEADVPAAEAIVVVKSLKKKTTR